MKDQRKIIADMLVQMEAIESALGAALVLQLLLIIGAISLLWVRL